MPIETKRTNLNPLISLTLDSNCFMRKGLIGSHLIPSSEQEILKSSTWERSGNGIRLL